MRGTTEEKVFEEPRGGTVNYTDFGVSGPDELEQDEWSLTRPTFETPKGGVMTVVGFIYNETREKDHVFVCSLCKKDPFNFGDGVFKSKKYKLKNGSISCGCSRRYVKSISQMIKECERSAPQGVEVLGYTAPLNGVNTKLRCFCDKHGEWSSTSVRKFLLGQGCPLCKGRRTWDKRRAKRDVDTIAKKVCKIKGVIFIKMVDGERANKGVIVKCPLHGLYTTSLSQLKNPARGSGCKDCKATHNSLVATLPDEYHIRKYESLKVFPEGCEFRKVGRRTKSGQMWLYSCPLCNEEVISSSSNLSEGKIPCSCGKNKQMQTYLLVIEDGPLEIALKVGKARVWHKRVKELNKRNLFKGRCIGVWEYPSVELCSSSEHECKQTLKTGIVSSREMSDGYTETVSILDIEKVIAIYEKHGGVRIK